MKTRHLLLPAFAVAALAAGCIISDSITILTISPDGATDLVRFRGNIHSSREGQAAEEELAAYRREFNTGQQQEFTRIADAGGEVTEARWIRDEPPFSNVLRGRLPDAAALEGYLSMDGGEDGWTITADFQRDGSRRTLTIGLAPPPQADPLGQQPDTMGELEQALADGLSQMRLVTLDGVITDAQGFVVAGDRQSALLSLARIEDTLEEKQEAELLLAWDVAASSEE